MNLRFMGKAQFTLSIRKKLMLVLLILLIIPVIGYRDIQNMESFLRIEQENALLENAQIIASVLQNESDLFKTSLQLQSQQQHSLQHLFVRPLLSNINLDGYADDWLIYRDRVQFFNNSEAGDSLKVKFRVGSFKQYVYILFQIEDESIVYRRSNADKIVTSDHLLINIENRSGEISRYIVSTYSPGKVNAYRISNTKTNQFITTIDKRILSFWQETTKGYNIELRIPINMIGDKLGFSVVDVDNAQSRKITHIINTSGSNLTDDLSTIVVPSPKINALLYSLERRNARIWVIDKNGRVIARAGNLIETKEPDGEMQQNMDETLSFKQFMSGTIRLLYEIILPQPSSVFIDDLSNASRIAGEEVTSSLSGKPAIHWRKTPDNRVNILRATYPVFDNQQVIGSVAVEETSNSILILQNRAIEILVNLSILAFIVATSTLLLFASRLSLRIRRLRDNTESAISADGKVRSLINSSSSSDEIGDLTRSFSSMLDRLSQYNNYLESMAGKLSHELRTPITVVRSSLDNLESSNIKPEDMVYINRAREGINRLANILTRMSEATRLEQTLQQEDKERFNLVEVVKGCVNGYQIANESIKFELTIENIDKDNDPEIYGSPDLIAQLLDKLISNAIDFNTKNRPIVILIKNTMDTLLLSICNEGPPLPEDIQYNLFDSMVSARDKGSAAPHLGLGLYIVRMISDFHQGQVSAKNMENNKGVCVCVTFPIYK